MSYNLNLCEGIRFFLEKEFDKSIKYFYEAESHIPMKMESYLLISLSHIQKSFNLPDGEKKKAEINKAFEMILKALSKNSKNAFIRFIKGYLEFSNQNYEKALDDFDFTQKFIEESIEVQEEVIFLKGMALSFMNNYVAASKKFFHLIHLKKKYVKFLHFKMLFYF